MKALSTKALTRKCLRTTVFAVRLQPVRVVRALRYPTCRGLAVQQALVPAFGRMMISVGNLYSFGLGALHGSSGLGVMTVHLVTHVS
jgi:hypothetical protein